MFRSFYFCEKATSFKISAWTRRKTTPRQPLPTAVCSGPAGHFDLCAAVRRQGLYAGLSSLGGNGGGGYLRSWERGRLCLRGWGWGCAQGHQTVSIHHNVCRERRVDAESDLGSVSFRGEGRSVRIKRQRCSGADRRVTLSSRTRFGRDRGLVLPKWRLCLP